MTKQVLVPIADGTEELEVVALIDILRRGGAQVTVASVCDLAVKTAHGLSIVADCLLRDCSKKQYDLIVLAGGSKGAEHFRDDKLLVSLLKEQKDSGRLYAAICASPAVVFEHHGLLQGKKATTYPSYVLMLKDQSRAQELVVIDGNCITSQAPGTAIQFSLTLAEKLFGGHARKQLEQDLVV